MGRTKENTERISTFLTKNDVSILRKQAGSEGSSVSLIIRRAVKEHIKRNKLVAVSEPHRIK